MKRVTLAMLLALAATPADAGTLPVVVQASPAQPDRILTMTGEGIVKAMPDTAVVAGGVVTRSRRAADALHDNNEVMTKTLAALKALGVTDKQITTSSVRFEPQYERDRNGYVDPSGRIIGYAVTNRIMVTLGENIERAGEVFDALIQNGANDRATFSFELRKIDALEEQARTAAAKSALAKAQIYARALGLDLGTVRFVSEAGARGFDSIQAYDVGALPDKNVAEALQRVPGVPVQANELTITKTVTVTWSLK